MGWYRRSKLMYDTFRNLGSKFIPKTPIQSPALPRIQSNCHYSSSSSFYNQRKFTGILGSPSISSKLGHSLTNLKQNQTSALISGITKRYYYVDRNQIRHFKARGFKRWFQNPRHLFIVTVIGGGVVITVYFGHLEVVPYTKRQHFVLLSRDLERKLGESQFKELKKSYKGKILPAIHPDSVRVRLIAKDIIDALQRGLSNDQIWRDPEYGSFGDVGNDNEGVGPTDEQVKALTEGLEEHAADEWRKEGELLDDRWVKESRKHGEMHGAKLSTQHLEGLNWEVLVVDEPVVNAFCAPGGKIVVFTGLLKHFKTDAEIATVVGHEVGHAVARHVAEQITKNLWLAIVQIVLYQFVTPDVVNAMSNLLLRLPFSRKMEMEADYIGLLLIASAGYDPRIAPRVYEKLGQVAGGDSALQDYLSTHPSGKKRAQLLAQAQVMEEALNLYRQVMAGRGVEGFL